ncbi:MAG: histidine phosphatase family protein [Patescibacteria group bacterium]
MKKNNYCTLYVTRHGETQWNIQGKVQGHTDSPLTREGVKQAKNLALEFKNIKFDAVYSSDLLRAKRTAEIATLEHKLTIETTEALRERSFGKYEGSNKKVLDLLEELRDKNIPYETENIENDENLTERIITFLREVAIAYPNKTILILTHGGVLVSLLLHLGFLTREQMRQYHVGNTSYIKLVCNGVDFFIKETKRIDKRV